MEIKPTILVIVALLLCGCEPQKTAEERAPKDQENQVRCAFGRDLEACKRIGVTNR